ncbi:hypothetical protein SAMN05443545_10916 [Aidingimonas halophila]|uniref:Uncharacterized protein n=1 Tax=Aidingimonas halophila TaxID=574349 RepID=A0A1H3G634_9GAMM|nr:hypothetical protein GCM10008094_26590 [Aidingimonas halophila]SDX98507.1 hypothetical protein SAMN05443545_10916 [Aidingimonas halophila]
MAGYAIWFGLYNEISAFGGEYHQAEGCLVIINMDPRIWAGQYRVEKSLSEHVTIEAVFSEHRRID